MKLKMVVTAFVLFCGMLGFSGFGSVQAAPTLVDFELEIELKNNSKYDIEYEAKNQTFEAKYQVPGRTTVYGQEAIAMITPLLKELNLSPSMNESDLKKKILSIFQIAKNDVDDFELEAKFDDGKKLKIDR